MANKYDDDYTRVYWKNLPSHNTPINQQNLNKMDAQIKTLTTRVSDMSTYVPNVMYVDELPEQGVEGLLYVTALIEHGITLDGELPDHFKSQSALDSWINDGNYAFMLHLRNVDEETNGDAYVIIENITVENFSMVPNFYTVQTIESGAGSNFYLYLTKDRTWYEQSFNGLEVGDKLVAVPLADNTNTKIGNEWYANTGDIRLGIENIMGNITLLNHYTSADNTYEIYQAKPIRVLDPRNVYMWNDDTRSFFGFQKEYEAGQNITFTQQGTKVIISATGGGSGVEDTVVTFTYNKTEGTVTCDTLWQDIINKYNAKTLKVQIREIQRNSAITRTVNLTQFKYGGGTTNDMYFEYLEGNIITTYKVIKNPNPNLEEYTITTITKDISGGGGGSDVIVPIYYSDATDNTLKCTMTFDEIYAYYSHTGTSIDSTNCLMPQYIDDQQDERFDCVKIKETTRNNKQCIMFAFRHWYLDGDTDAKTAYDKKIYHFYDDTIGTAGAYQSYKFQTELTSANAGSGISITQVDGKPVISVNYPNGDMIEY